MKKTLLTLALVATSVAAFAQGKIAFVNDSLHVMYITSSKTAADDSLVGQATPVGGVLPSGVTLMMGLYGGTASTSLSLYSTTTQAGNAAPGRFNQVSVNLSSPFIGGGTTAFFQVAVWDSAYASPTLAQNAGSYYGYSIIFTTVASGTIAYNSIVNHSAPASSTWTDGTFALGGGNMGAIAVGVVPEPSSFALAGLGMASLMIFRRRK